MERRAAVIGVALAGCLLGASPAAAAEPRCRVVKDPKALAAGPLASDTGGTETVSVVIPRVVCKPDPHPTKNPGKGVSGNGGGAAVGGAGGGIPFTGLPFVELAVLAGGLVAAGSLFQRVGRRRLA